MLAGLLFAHRGDGPAAEVAAADYAGATLIEHQARCLRAAGAGHLVILGTVPPCARAAVARIAKGDGAVDVARDARAAADAFHPLAGIVMLAHGLVEPAAAIARVADLEGEALLILSADGAPPALERMGGGQVWAGVARMLPQRLAQLAEMPADYDACSTLIRLLASAGVPRIDAAAAGVPIVARGPADLRLAQARRLDAASRTATAWFDRVALVPAARALAVALAERGVAAMPVAAASWLLVAATLLLVVGGRTASAGVAALAALLAGSVARIMARLAERAGLDRALAGLGAAAAGVGAVALGIRHDLATGGGAGAPIAVALVAAAALAERSAAAPARWWSGASCVAILLLGAVLGQPIAGLAVAAVYAGSALAAAVERLRGLSPALTRNG